MRGAMRFWAPSPWFSFVVRRRICVATRPSPLLALVVIVFATVVKHQHLAETKEAAVFANSSTTTHGISSAAAVADAKEDEAASWSGASASEEFPPAPLLYSSRRKRQLQPQRWGGGGTAYCPSNCFQCNGRQCAGFQLRCIPSIVNCCCQQSQKFDLSTACDGDEAVAACMNGLCGQGFYCTRQQYCCRCANGKSIGRLPGLWSGGTCHDTCVMHDSFCVKACPIKLYLLQCIQINVLIR